MIHELPAAAQLGAIGTHFQIERMIEHTEGSIHVVGRYGSLDAEGEWVDAGLGSQSVAIPDRATYDAEATDRPKPSTRADPVSHMRSDVLEHLDAQGLWPGQGS